MKLETNGWLTRFNSQHFFSDLENRLIFTSRPARPVGRVRYANTSKNSALNAKATNGACKALFNRLVAKGKNKKLAIIAVANKLLKQVFGMVKNECLFDRNYYKKKQPDLFGFLHSLCWV